MAVINDSFHFVAEYNAFAKKIFAYLRDIDAEATPLENGTPIGLWWYARHGCQPEALPKSYRNEEKWSSRLKEKLKTENIAASTEKRYPTPPRRRCDLVIEPWPGLGRLWLEVKGSWLHHDSKASRPNIAYKKHLSAAGKDVAKVLTLGPDVADHVGMLLIGFDTTSDPIQEKEVNLVRPEIGAPGWEERYTEWADKRINGRVRAWLWLKPVGKFKSEVVARFIFEGGGVEIYRVDEGDRKASFHSKWTSMTLDKNEDEVWRGSRSQLVSNFEDALCEVLADESWIYLQPSEIHVDFRKRTWQAVEEAANRLASEDRERWNRKRSKWQGRCGVEPAAGR